MAQIGLESTKRLAAKSLIVGGLLCVLGCDRADNSLGDATAAKARPASAWHVVGENDAVVAVDDANFQGQLEAAIAKARSTMDAARDRFNAASAIDRAKWIINWAAPLDDTDSSRVEYVWVVPINWSPFRIEGTLVSSPVHELTAGKVAGDLVSFPVDELADWHVHSNAKPPTEADGGFTLNLLANKFGHPPAARP